MYTWIDLLKISLLEIRIFKQFGAEIAPRRLVPQIILPSYQNVILIYSNEISCNICLFLPVGFVLSADTEWVEKPHSLAH